MTPGGDAVAAAFEATPRRDFLPPRLRHRSGEDAPLPIGDGATCSQPSTVASMLRLLDVGPGHRVLDVGAGSGWTTALLAHLVGPAGDVLGLEVLPRVTAAGAAHVAATGRPWARLEQADPAVLGRPADGPYDRVLVSAMAATLPEDLVAQLAPDGVLVGPVAGTMHRVHVDTDGRRTVTSHGAYRFVPLVQP